MGGRGASSASNIKAVEINVGTQIISYRQQSKGRVSDINNYDIQETNKTIQQIVNKAKEQGYEVKTYNAEQLKEYDKQRKKEREQAVKNSIEHYYSQRGASTMKKRGFVR